MRTRSHHWLILFSFSLGFVLLAPERAAADEDDPPRRVARLAFTTSDVSFNPAGTDDWVTAVVNRPITTGDKLWSGNGARAELHIGSAAIRLSVLTYFAFQNLTDDVAQLRLTQGTLNIRVRRLGDDETFEVDTRNLAFSIPRPGRYRINVNEAGDATIVTVHDGQGEVTGGGSAYTLHAREEGVFNGTDQLHADERISEDEDDFDQWCNKRDLRDDHSVSSRYVSDDVIGYEDLDDYGGWRRVPEYGAVWFPHTVIVGWAPYRYGQWVWISASTITEEISALPSAHILVISDSCYSGALTRNAPVAINPSDRDAQLRKLLESPSQTLMASGRNEPVADGRKEGHSIFAYALIQSLRQIDQDQFTATELFNHYVQPRVAGGSDQVPQYSVIQNSGHEYGEFVFIQHVKTK